MTRTRVGAPLSVAGASRSRIAEEHGRDAHATAGETPALPPGPTQEPTSDSVIIAGLIGRHKAGLLAAMVLLAVILAPLGMTWFMAHRTTIRAEPKERQLTANPLEDHVSGAAISPDGKHLAYVDQTGLYLRFIDSGETHPVPLPADVAGRICDVRWFPEGGKLLAALEGADGSELWVITVLGEAAPQLLYRTVSLSMIVVATRKAGLEVVEPSSTTRIETGDRRSSDKGPAKAWPKPLYRAPKTTRPPELQPMDPGCFMEGS